MIADDNITYMKKYFIFLLLLSLCIILCACGKENSLPENSNLTDQRVESTPPPTAEPATTVSFMGKEVLISDLESGYTFDLFGQTVNTVSTTELHYVREEINDSDLATFREVLPFMPNLSYLTFDRCNTTDAEVAKLREDFKDSVKIAWRVFFDPFSCMTDTEKIWASCDLRDDKTEALRYCNDVKYLDIGHNALHSLWFLEYMPELEVLILSCSEEEDISEVAYCKKLIFLECAEMWVRDLTPISELSDTLEFLNVGGNANIPADFSMFDNMKKLKRFYCQNYFNYNINMEEEQKRFESLMPGCEVNFDWAGSHTAINTKWRYTRDGEYNGDWNIMYLKIREIFDYDNPCGSSRLYYDDDVDLDYSNPVIVLDFGF